MSAADVMDSIKALSESERETFYSMLIADNELREDLFDSLLIVSRRDEESRPLSQVLSDLKISL